MSVPLQPIFRKAYWSLVGFGSLYVLFLLALTNPWLQRQGLYLHHVNSVFWHDLSQPQQWGFLESQVSALNISTPDGETLYAWHVLPLGAASEHEAALIDSKTNGDEYTRSKAFELLQQKDSKLVIKFHGNAGHVGQGWRTDTYRALTAADNENLHVLAVDYRGFGHSTGAPNEHAIIRDAITTVTWALEVAQIPPERITLFGQSLGVAVTIAVAEHFAINEQTDFKGLVLCAGFSDLPTLLQTYAIGHFIPVFSPLRPYPTLLKWFSKRIVDDWPSTTRLYNFVKASKNVNIQFFHALNDYDIPWYHSRQLFYAAVNATSNSVLHIPDIEAAKEHRDLTRGGFIDTWKAGTDAGGTKKIRFTVLRDGGHNRIMTYAPITRAIMDAFAGR